VCFLAGSLMLGATTAGARVRGSVSVPPRADELTEIGKRDWDTGLALLEGCMETHKTATYVRPGLSLSRIHGLPVCRGLSPEIVQFVPSAGQPTRDWHIKGSKCVLI
jgi:hypothetical protein